MDSKKKRLWEARKYGSTPNFVLLTVETPHRQPARKGPTWVAELRRRANCLRRFSEQPAARAKLCREFGISERTLRQWQQCYRREGLAGLIPASRRPQCCPRQTPAWLERVILALRLRTGWGVARIAEEINRSGLGPVTHNGVYGVLERRAIKVPLVRRSRHSGCRYQRELPNQLWHMDVKGPLFFAPGVGPCYGFAILDDCSRFCVGAKFAPRRQMEVAIEVLERAVERWGAPRQLMSDNGSEFVGIKPAGPSRFVARLQQLGIEHRRIRYCSPETNGKIERFWLTLDRELLMRVAIDSLRAGNQELEGYLEEYNFRRLHSALDYLPPAQVYCPSQAAAPLASDLQAILPFLRECKELSKTQQ